MKKLISALLVMLFVYTQSSARAGTFDFNSRFNEIAHEISSSRLNSDELIDKSKNTIIQAKESGMTEEDILSKLSEKMALGLTQDEIRDSLEDLRSNPSQQKIQDIANQLTQKQDGDKFIQVLITFALLSLLLIGLFWIIAAPYPR